MYDGTTDLTDVTSPLARTISQLNPAGGVLNANANGNYYVLYLFSYKHCFSLFALHKNFSFKYHKLF